MREILTRGKGTGGSNTRISTICRSDSPEAPIATVDELVRWARQRPGHVTYTSAGIGTGPHLLGELFKLEHGLDMPHVPYRGTAQAYPDVMAGRVPVIFERARFHELRDELERDHREVQALWGKLRKPLEGIAEGLTRNLSADDVQAFAAAYVRHILAEESALQEFFNRWLDDADRVALGRSMSARRNAASPPAG